LDEAQDAAVIQTDKQLLVQSVDQISAICDDPYVFGKIATVHALSDVLASGANPHSAQVLVTLPFADQRVVKRDLVQLMAGVVDALNEHDCSLIGGHTSEDATLSLGLVVNGFIDKPNFNESHKASIGDQLILTKPGGSGILLAGMMQQRAAGSDMQSLYAQLQCSNRIAAKVFEEYGITDVTDITGFGLLGHLQRLLNPLSVGAKIEASQVPFYDGARDLAVRGIRSTLLDQNQQVLEQVENSAGFNDDVLNLLCDPQTSGGLLAVVPADSVSEIMQQLQSAGCSASSVIGTVTSAGPIRLTQ